MEWIKDKRRPEIIETIDNWGKSKPVVVLCADKEPIVAEYNKGIEDGEQWEQWYSGSFDDIIENVTGWCDCIPDVK